MTTPRNKSTKRNWSTIGNSRSALFSMYHSIMWACNFHVKYFETSVTSGPRVTSVTQSFICVTCSSGSFCSVILIMMSLLDLSWNSNFHKILMAHQQWGIFWNLFYAPEWSYHHFIINLKINFQPNHTILYNKSYPAERAFRFLSKTKPTTNHLEVLSSLGRLKLYWGSRIILVG